MKKLLTSIAEFARASPGEMGLMALLGVSVVLGSMFVFTRTAEPPAPPIELTKVVAEPEEAQPLVIHVAGMVVAPGLYELEAGSRVADAIEAAGGPTPEAQLDSLNLAAPVVDGQKVYVPAEGEAPPEGSSEAPQGKVNLNTATTKQLEELPGVGPVTAEKIIAFRKEKGGFSSVKQLLEIDGIGPKKYEAIKDLVDV